MTLKLSEIIPYGNNPRENDGAVEDVAESIKQCGYISPIILDEDHVILAGHTRLRALQELGKNEADVMVVSGLSDEQKRKYRLLDNKTNELATWNFEKLEQELEGLDFDGYDFGLDVETEELKEAHEDDYSGGADTEPKVQRGQTYKLGRHRLMCGDATSAEDFEILMGGH